MNCNSQNPLDSYWSFIRCKDNESVCKMILFYVENGTGYSISELKKRYNEKQLFFEALKHVVTTKKSLIKAMNINLDNACWYKKELQEDQLLAESIVDYQCPYTRYPARLITTNKEWFNALGTDNTNQCSLW